MQDRARRWKRLGLGIALAGGLAAGAGAGTFDNDLYIMAPPSVIAGEPISGYAYGLEYFGQVVGNHSTGAHMGTFPSDGSLCTYFIFLTYEPMAGTLMTIRAHDEDESAVVSVIII